MRACSEGGWGFLQQGGSLELGTVLDMRHAGGCLVSAWSDAWVGHTKRQVRGPSSQVLVRGREQLATGRSVCEDKDQVGFYWSS